MSVLIAVNVLQLVKISNANHAAIWLKIIRIIGQDTGYQNIYFWQLNK